MYTDAGLAALGYPSPDERYDMPDLGDLYSNNMGNVSLDRFTGQFKGPTAYPHFNMWMNLVRLTDQAILDHEAARGHLNEYRDNAREGRVSTLYRAVNELENTVVATYRAVLNSRQLESHAPRRLIAPTNRQAEALRKVRNHIQHMDDKLQKGQVKPGQLHLLAPTTHRVEIGGERLTYRDLSSCIRKMYRNIEIVRQAPSR